MMRIRRYLRGSGRVLAFVFIASVIWLLLDMAALRMSMDDVNSQLLKERVIRDREVSKQQRGTPLGKQGFKNPVQRVDFAVTRAGKGPLSSSIKLAHVYRHGGQKAGHQGGHLPKAEEPKHVASEHKEGQHSDTPKQDGPAMKKAVDLDLNGMKSETSRGMDGVIKETLPVVASNATRVVHKNKHGMKGPIHFEPKVETVTEVSVLKRVEAHPVKTTTKLIQKDGKGKLVDDKPEEKHSRTVIKSDSKAAKETPKAAKETPKAAKETPKAAKETLKAAKETPKPAIKPLDSKDNSVTAGVHKVISLDLTNVPRDANAMGQFGQAALVASNEDAEVRKRWNEGHFNVFLSDKIPVDRAVPDTRPEMCAQHLVHDNLPSTSVIFCFVDEVWSTLLRSVHSVLNRSPPHLLTEIILVDDFSTKDYLKEQLNTYMAQFPKVRIIRLKERQGLIRARLAGAAVAKGEVLTFLDSHIECNVGWLEPLLERVYLDRKKVPCPVIEVISDKDMSYLLVDNFQRGVFKWPLVFGWSALPEEYIRKNNMTDSDPIRQKTVERNLARVAEVWLDEYKDLFYGHGYHHLRDRKAVNIGNLTDQIELRKKLKCKSFQWYLDNVYPDMKPPLVQAEGLADHLIAENTSKRMCLEAGPKGDTLHLNSCDSRNAFQKWEFTKYHTQ
ncbi:Polypeptide N-acetylgalactosaminyltransferase 5 [Liparis tanakae]|uniref:Polypeptide N-acetylgalactosaminyltransferase n=1 Tax=Liparis tanakae TaxID=230148 RepID=A0A4Z2J2S7_9TELE|nr:Polypeptide N-acetylgalactosaminyltransferase 5 [Liparis tanakae]